jgi:hypothetical protein
LQPGQITSTLEAQMCRFLPLVGRGPSLLELGLLMCLRFLLVAVEHLVAKAAQAAQRRGVEAGAEARIPCAHLVRLYLVQLKL